MNRNWVYSLFALWIVCSFACTQPKPVANVEVQKENFVFSIKGTDTLSLDKYELPSISPASKKPVMIFAFGGGFKGGDKADKGYIPYFEFLARNGFVVVSTDYRTTLKNLDPSKVSSPMDFIAALQHAIDTAVEDFYDATGFVINQSSDWNIDVEQIVASGSSAGAITVLQAEYDLCNGHELAKRLPAGFNYAGVISYAGAVSGVLPPHWEKMPCPIMLFHGDADKRRIAVIPGGPSKVGYLGAFCLGRSSERQKKQDQEYTEQVNPFFHKKPFLSYLNRTGAADRRYGRFPLTTF